ncbi:amidohydrolase [Nocardioides sp.]|uniref:amidohydrolase n=1 Tax=Nocardioides sp. TaxID=35761 RepID=UPI003512085B
MTALLLRDVRLVALQPGEVAPEHPVDVLIATSGDGDGRVLAVGPGLERPAGADEIDAGGRWLVPGLWDAHVHLGQWTSARSRLDTREVRSVAEALALVGTRLAQRPGAAVIGWGHRPAAWDPAPTTADLDAIAPATPVVLVAGDGHQAWVNTAAQVALDLPRQAGPVEEDVWFAAYARLGELSGPRSGVTPDDYAETLRAAAALGITGVVELEFSGGLAAWRERWEHGCDLLRVRVGVYADDLEATLAEGLRSGDRLLSRAADPRGLLTMGPLKIISDGSLTTRTAWCRHAYADTGTHGAANLDAAELGAHLARAHAGGLEVAVHAIGDAALDQALDAYDASGARGSLEHVQLAEPAQVRRIARLGLRASVQPHHLVDDRDLAERVWPGRTQHCFPLRDLHEAGVALALGSDAPVSPLDPWLAIDAAVTRTGDERGPWHPEQSLTRREALAASVDGRAMPAPGAPADVVLVDDDPLTAARPGVALTIVAGRVVHGGV